MTSDALTPEPARQPGPGGLPDRPEDPGHTSTYPDLGATDPAMADYAYGLDDTEPSVATSEQSDSAAALAANDYPYSSDAGSGPGQEHELPGASAQPSDPTLMEDSRDYPDGLSGPEGGQGEDAWEGGTRQDG